MTWFRIDDGFHEHAKVEALEGDPVEHAFAIAAWTLCGSACSRRLTDGVVTRAALAKTLAAWPEKQRARAAAALVRVGLWDVHPDGWAYHDWHDRNPTRDDVLKEREAGRRRQAEWKAKRRGSNGGSNDPSNGGSNAAGNGVTSPVASGTPTRPDPTRSRSEISSASSRSGHASATRAALDDADGSFAGLAEGAWTRVVGERGGSYQAHPTRDAKVLRAVAEIVARTKPVNLTAALELSARAFWAQRRSPKALPENWLEWLQREASSGHCGVSPASDFVPSPVPGKDYVA